MKNDKAYLDERMGRLLAHPLEELGAPRSFVLRLAEDNGWTATYAQRVVTEYRRFAWLAMQGQGMASPSDAVDQAWHLHLCESRDYWEVFCPTVLGGPLHHEPSRGGESGAGHARSYEATLVRYRAAFGEPPSDIWPATPPGMGPRHVRMALQPAGAGKLSRWLRALMQGMRRGPWAATAGLVLAAAAFADDEVGAGWNVLNWQGPDFLLFYVAALVVLWLVHLLEGRVWRLFDDSGSRMVPARLDPYEAAYLADGHARAADTALLGLLQRNWVTIDGDHLVKLPGDGSPIPAPEKQLYASMRPRDHRLAVRNRSRAAIRGLVRTLQDKGLVTSEATVAMQRLPLVLLTLGLWLVGAAKAAVGIARARPVVFLVILLAVFGLFIVWFWRNPKVGRRRTCFGDTTLEHLRQQYRQPDVTDPLQVLYRVAMIGSAGLIGTPWAFAQPMYQPMGGSDASSGDYSGSSDSNIGCSGGGGCGGGGGGCGGCGGGGD